MNKDQLVNYLEAEKRAGVRYVCLQDCDFDQKPSVSNCIREFYPNAAKAAMGNSNIDKVIADLPNYVYQYPKYYKLHTKRAPNGKWKTVDLAPESDSTMAEPMPTFEPKPEMIMNDVRSFEEALKDKAKIADLESKVRELQREVADLEATIDELEAEAADNQSTQMADASTTALGQVATLLPGIIDRFFEMQERKIQAMGAQRPMPNKEWTQTQSNGQHKPQENTTVYEDYGL